MTREKRIEKTVEKFLVLEGYKKPSDKKLDGYAPSLRQHYESFGVTFNTPD